MDERICEICGKSFTGLQCQNKWCNETYAECRICKNVFREGGMYEYRGFLFCEEHIDEGEGKVDNKRKEVSKVTEASVKSQANGEWANGGYKHMKTDISGRPIPTKVKEPLILQDYEKGIL